MEPKAFYQSKTLLGSLSVMVGFALQACGVAVPADQISHAFDTLANGISDLMFFGGFVVMVYGRLVAVHPLSWGKAKAKA